MPFPSAEEPAPSGPENPTSCTFYATFLVKQPRIGFSRWIFIIMFSRFIMLLVHSWLLRHLFSFSSVLQPSLDGFQLYHLTQGKLRHGRVQLQAGGHGDCGFSCSYPQIQLTLHQPWLCQCILQCVRTMSVHFGVHHWSIPYHSATWGFNTNLCG